VPGVEATLLQACHMHIHPAHCTLQQVILSLYPCRCLVELRCDQVVTHMRRHCPMAAEPLAASATDLLSSDSCEVTSALQIPETLPDEVVAKMHGPPKPDVPRVTTAHLEEADGLLLGFPTR